MKDINKTLNNFLYQVASEIANTAKNIAPVDTSNLKNDIQVFDDNLHNNEIKIGNSKIAPYAQFVHEGTKPYTIKPLKKKALKNPYGIFKKVNHPGIKGNPYLKTALDQYISSSSFNRAIESLEQNLSINITKAIVKNLDLKNMKVEIK